MKNPWFKHLPVGQTKGDVLTIKSSMLPEDESVNRKCFVLPLGNHEFRTGSTYEWDSVDLTPSMEAKKEILEHLSYLTKKEPEVINHDTGIRPTSLDRRPIFGTHPSHEHYHIFNGLGAKGFMICPLLSDEFSEYLLSNVPLSKEVDLKRFMKK